MAIGSSPIIPIIPIYNKSVWSYIYKKEQRLKRDKKKQIKKFNEDRTQLRCVLTLKYLYFIGAKEGFKICTLYGRSWG